jgi:hypothetical protein
LRRARSSSGYGPPVKSLTRIFFIPLSSVNKSLQYVYLAAVFSPYNEGFWLGKRNRQCFDIYLLGFKGERLEEAAFSLPAKVLRQDASKVMSMEKLLTR